MKLFIYRIILILFTISVISPVSAQADEHSSREHATNFAAMYGAQWTFYLISQKDIIAEHGSFENWKTYPFQPDFDKDSFDYNIIKHSIAGQYYYHFYRYRGYSQIESFTWSFLSSLAFEFTIETYTEKPSFQDMYQTPVYGAILGIGTEQFSKYLLTKNSYAAHLLAYILNPFELLQSSPDLSIHLNGDLKNPTLLVSWGF